MAERPTFGDPSFVSSRQTRRQGLYLAGGLGVDGQYWQQHQFLDGEGVIVAPGAAPIPHANSLHEAIAPYVDLTALRELVVVGGDIRQSFRLNGGEPPEELAAMFAALKTLLRPPETYQIKNPHELASYLMLDMGFLDQEQFKVACLNTKNHLQKVHLVYQGSLNTSLIRVGEVFREPIRLNSAAAIIAHNHPSSDPTPSPEDVAVTREIMAAGNLLDIELLDHLVIGQGKWVSMRQLGLL